MPTGSRYVNAVRNKGNYSVSSDLGDSNNVHPQRKQQVGERSAGLALHFIYGWKHVVLYGPMPLDAALKNGKITIRFDYAKRLNIADTLPLKGFSLTDARGITREAEAVIDGKVVVIPVSGRGDIQYVFYG